MSTSDSANSYVAIVAGGSGALGRATVLAMAAAGWRVVVLDQRPVADLPTGVEFEGCHAGSAEECTQAVQRVVDRHGAIHALAQLVGGYVDGQTIRGSRDSDIQAMLELNFYTTLHLLRAVLPAMQTHRYGRIVTVGSKGAEHPWPGITGYSVAKAAVMNLTQVAAAEGSEHGITANCVLPSILDTPANRSAMPGADYGKWVATTDLAATIVHLCSPQSGGINGQWLRVYARS